MASAIGMATFQSALLDRRSIGAETWDRLQKLRDQGWRVRFKKRGRSAFERSSVSHFGLRARSKDEARRARLEEGLRAAVLAYRDVAQSGNPNDLPCRAALNAYKRVCGENNHTSDLVIKALVSEIRRAPDPAGRRGTAKFAS